MNWFSACGDADFFGNLFHLLSYVKVCIEGIHGTW